MLPDAAKDRQTIATTFGDVEKFFASKNKSDAVMWAQTARGGSHGRGRRARRLATR